MADKKNILLRLDKDLYASVAKWAADDLRSINAQIEFLLSDAVKRSGRQKARPAEDAPAPPERP